MTMKLMFWPLTFKKIFLFGKSLLGKRFTSATCGHSFLSCDRCFGVTKKYLKKKDYVFSPNEYANFIKQSSKHLVSILVQEYMILNFDDHYREHFKKMILTAKKQRFRISKYRIFQYSKKYLDGIRVSVSTGMPIFPYFQTLREFENNLSLSSNIPVYHPSLSRWPFS